MATGAVVKDPRLARLMAAARLAVGDADRDRVDIMCKELQEELDERNTLIQQIHNFRNSVSYDVSGRPVNTSQEKDYGYA
jgi:hypothetical protein